MNHNQIKLLVKHLLGKDLFVRTRIDTELEGHGNRYAEWRTPAGWVNGDSVVYSFGIGEDASWDLGLAAANGCTVHGFDPTPKSLAWVENHARDPRFVVHPWALAARDGTLTLWLPKNEEHVSASCRASDRSSAEKITVPCRSIPSIMKELGHERVDVLKMDVEGAEYEVIAKMLEDKQLARTGVILVEFHHWMSSFSIDDTRRAIAALEEGGFLPAWVSETGHEILFMRPDDARKC